MYRTPLANLLSSQLNTQGGILAIYKWDNTVFDNFVVPSDMDKDIAVDTIFDLYGIAPLFHNDPEYLKYYIGAWSKRKVDQWQKLWETTQYEYDPIYNYDRTEEFTDTRIGGQKDSRTYSEDIDREGKSGMEASDTRDTTTHDTNSVTVTDKENITDTGSQDVLTDSEDSRTIDSNVIHSVSAENVDTFQNDSKDDTLTTDEDKANSESKTQTTNNRDMDRTQETEGEADGTQKVTGSQKQNDIWQDGEKKTGGDVNDRDYNETLTHKLKAYGNIGTTTTQDMIKAERDIVTFNVYEYIAQDFYKEFCLGVW